MRKLGYILLVSGFLWLAFFAVEISPWARSVGNLSAQKLLEHQGYTDRDVTRAIGRSADSVATFASIGFAGGLLMLGGGIILGWVAKRGAPAAPPVIRS